MRMERLQWSMESTNKRRRCKRTLLVQCPPPKQACQNVYELSSMEQVVKYLHATWGFPTKPTIRNAVCKNWLVGWPELTVERVNKLFPESNETQKGHMKQQRQGVRSTKV